MRRHVIKLGEHLPAVTAPTGLLAMTVWNLSDNSEVRRTRQNPCVLKPGDVVVIPELRKKNDNASTGAVHRYVVKKELVKLRFRIYDVDNKPLAGMKAVLEVEGDAQDVTTDANGIVERHIVASAKNGSLKIPALNIDLAVAIGRLQPAAEPAGWRARLINLGYYRGAADDEGPVAKKFWAWALEEFQCDFGLKVTGEADAETVTKLASVHGS